MNALLYHDILREGSQHSGFPGADAQSYKLTEVAFRQHLALLPAKHDMVFTFDDGGCNSIHPCADLIETHGIRGHYFIPTGFIGNPTFLDGPGLRDLSRRGHYIGSHSVTHPIPISALSIRRLEEEWHASKKRLEDIIGREVEEASVPGGFTSRRVEEAVAAAGYKRLYTSEPVQSVRRLGELEIIGRFSITVRTRLKVIESVMNGRQEYWRRQRMIWEMKSALKRAGGPAWLSMRRLAFHVLEFKRKSGS